MKENISKLISKQIPLKEDEILSLIETPPNKELGDFAFPCFSLAKVLKKNPVEIAKSLAIDLSPNKDFEKIQATGPYVNFFIDKKSFSLEILKKIQKEKNKFGSSNVGKSKKIVIDMSSPNIAKPFGIGHLRSTIIGNSIAQIYSFQGYKAIKLNYLGDWGTPFGKIIAGYLEFGSEKKLKENPIKHLYEIYVRASEDKSFEEKGRDWFKKLEEGDKKALALWKKFRDLSLKDFNRIYKMLGVSFDVISGESVYNNKMQPTLELLKKKNLLEESEGALIVNLEKYGAGVCLIQKSDGATLYATRDLTAAIDRYNKYKFSNMFYEVGAEQKLHFKQIFKVLELLGFSWAKDCVHIDHGLYLDKDGKKFATRKGKTLFMEDIFDETKTLAKQELKKREKLSEKELESRALAITRAAIIYGDLRNYRSADMTFDTERFLSFEGNTGPYLLYSYARAKSILKKSKKKSFKLNADSITEKEKELILKLSVFPEVVAHAADNLSPNIIANYSYELSQLFNEFYHSSQVIGSDEEDFRLLLVESFSQVLKNSLALLGIDILESM